MRPPYGLIPIITLAMAWGSTSPSAGQLRSEASGLSFWTVGGAGVDARFGPELYRELDQDRDAIDQLLLAIAEEPLPRDRILERTALSRTHLLEIITTLEALHIIRQEGKSGWATTVPVITDDELKRLRRRLARLARGVTQEVQGKLSGLVARYEQVKSPQDPPWEDVAHLMIDKFIIDGTFHSAVGEVERDRHGRRDDGENQQLIPAFFLERGGNFTAFGSNWYPFTEGDAQREVYVLHGWILDRYDIRMNAYRGDRNMSAALFGITPAGGLESVGATGRELLGALGWIGNDRLLVPVVQAATVKALWPTLEEIGVEAARVVSENLAVITEAFDSSPYARFLDADDDYVQACYHTLFGVVLGQLVETGVVPNVPHPVPEHFGVYIIMGKLF